MVLASTPRQSSGRESDGTRKRSLAAILRDRGPLAVTDAVDIALDVCDALANAHANGVVHGDLGIHRVRTTWPRVPGEPVEIFALGEDDSAARSLRASAAGVLVAPEQREGRGVDARADVWAVGGLLHWMISGLSPNVAPITETLAGLPRPLVATIEACLEVDPERRPRSVDEITERLASFSSDPAARFEQLARRRVALAASSSSARTERGAAGDDAATTLWASQEPHPIATNVVVGPAAPHAQPASIPPVSFPSAPPPRLPMASPAFSTRERSLMPLVLGAVGFAVTLALAMTFGPRLLGRAPSAASAASPASVESSTPPPRATDVSASPATPASDPSGPPLVTPTSLPDAFVSTPANLPDAPKAGERVSDGRRPAETTRYAPTRSVTPSASAPSDAAIMRSLDDALRTTGQTPTRSVAPSASAPSDAELTRSLEDALR